MIYLRVALNSSITLDMIARYLPSNYEVVGQYGHSAYIKGEDYAGWTADDYVIPRLSSGMIFAEKINEAAFVAATRPGE